MFKSAATKIAHNSTIPSLGGNKDLKALQDMITAEKAVLQSLQRLSADFIKSSECLRSWGVGEGDDLGDTLSASTTLLSHLASALSQFASHEQNVREYMKAVRTREEGLDEMRRRRKALGAKSETAEKKLSKMSSEHKNLIPQTELLNSLRDQIRNLDWEILSEEARLGDFKRTTTKNWMMLKFGGLLECAEKATIVGELGRLVIDEIPLDVTQPGQPRVMYTGYEKAEKLVAEAQRCVAEVVFDPQPVNEGPPKGTSTFSNANVNELHPGQSPNVPSQIESMPSVDTYSGRPMDSFISSTAPMSSGLGLDSYMGSSSNLNSEPLLSGGPRYDEFGASDRRDRPQQGPYGSMPSSAIRIGDDGSRIGVPPQESFMSSQPAKPTGGQFATFPVRREGGLSGGRPLPGSGSGLGSGPGYQLRDDIGDRRISASFSAEVADALAYDPQFHIPQKAADEPASRLNSLDGPAPTYESHYNPPSGLPRGAAPPAPPVVNPWDVPEVDRPTPSVALSGTVSAPTNGDEGETQLAYANRPSIDKADRHVRFGGDAVIGKEAEGSRGKVNQPQDSYKEEGSGGENIAPILEPSHPPPNYPDSANSPTIPDPPSERVPTREPAMDEVSLNAAAAREISREMDALSFNPPPVERAPSPLVPPAPPFAVPRSISPNPSGSVTGALPQRPASPMTSSPTERFHSSPPASPSHQQAPSSPITRNAMSPRPTLVLPERTSSSLGNGSDYGTPPEYPRTLSRGNSPAPPPMVPGTRTISAAAFKRPQMRSPSGSDSPRGNSDVSPLVFKKKALPSSPYPQRLQSNLSSDPVEPESRGAPPVPVDKELASPVTGHGSAPVSPVNRGNQPPVPPEHPAQVPLHVGAHDDEADGNLDFISSYGTVGQAEGSPKQQDFGRLGNVQVTNTSPGYGQGRFATNLDDNLR